MINSPQQETTYIVHMSKASHGRLMFPAALPWPRRPQSGLVVVLSMLIGISIPTSSLNKSISSESSNWPSISGPKRTTPMLQVDKCAEAACSFLSPHLCFPQHSGTRWKIWSYVPPQLVAHQLAAPGTQISTFLSAFCTGFNSGKGK